jgi:hypothetical protein
VDIRVVTVGAVDMEEAEVVTTKVVAAILTTPGIIQATAVMVTTATQDIMVMKREDMDIMTDQVTVAITVNTGDTRRATMMEEVIMGSIIMGKRAGKVQNTVKVEDIRKGTPPRDLTRYTKRTSTKRTINFTMNTTTEVTTASMEVLIATTASTAEVMKMEDIIIQVITMAITGRRVITLRAITAMTIRATQGRMDTTVTTATTTNMVVRVVPLADPATVTVAAMAGEVAEAMEAVVTEADMVGAMVVTVAVVTGNKYYKRGTRYLLLSLFNRVLHF